MTLNELARKTGFEIANRGTAFEQELTGGYASDLLSDVMGHAEQGMVWITLQVHRNVVAVAALKELAAVVLINGARFDADTLEQARTEGVTVLCTEEPAFEVSGRIYQLLHNAH